MRERNNTSLQYVIYMFRKKELQDNTSNQFMREAKYTRNSDNDFFTWNSPIVQRTYLLQVFTSQCLIS